MVGFNATAVLPTTFQANWLSGSPCVLWLRADFGITLNGSTISQWNDRSGLGNNATQATANQQPTYQATGWPNGKPAVQYPGGTGINMATGSTVKLGAFSAFLVAKTSVGGSLYGHGVTDGGIRGGRALGTAAQVMWVDGAVPISGTSYHFTQNSTAVSATGSHFTTEVVVGQHIASSAASTTLYVVDTITDDTHLVLHTNYATTSVTNATASIWDSTATATRSDLQPNSLTWQTDNAAHALLQRYNGTQATHLLAVDGTDQAPYTVSIAGNPGTLAYTTSVVIGNAANVFTVAPTGLIGEIALYNRSLTAGEAAQLRAYSQSFWGTP